MCFLRKDSYYCVQYKHFFDTKYSMYRMYQAVTEKSFLKIKCNLSLNILLIFIKNKLCQNIFLNVIGSKRINQFILKT